MEMVVRVTRWDLNATSLVRVFLWMLVMVIIPFVPVDESGRGHQWRLWKWASFCASETASWAMAKSWLDVQVDMELVRLQPRGMDKLKELEEIIERRPENGDGSKAIVGPDHRPLQVLNQQPRDLSALLQKLHSSDTVPELVTRACEEQHRQIVMSLMLGDIPTLMDLIWSWITPSENEGKLFREMERSALIIRPHQPC